MLIVFRENYTKYFCKHNQILHRQNKLNKSLFTSYFVFPSVDSMPSLTPSTLYVIIVMIIKVCRIANIGNKGH